MIWTISDFSQFSMCRMCRRDISFSSWLNFKNPICMQTKILLSEIIWRKHERNSLITFKWDSYFGCSCHFNVGILIFYIEPQWDYACQSTCFHVFNTKPWFPSLRTDHRWPGHIFQKFSFHFPSSLIYMLKMCVCVLVAYNQLESVYQPSHYCIIHER